MLGPVLGTGAKTFNKNKVPVLTVLTTYFSICVLGGEICHFQKNKISMKKNIKQKKVQRMTVVRSVALLMGLLDSDTWRCKMQGHELCSHLGEVSSRGGKVYS